MIFLGAVGTLRIFFCTEPMNYLFNRLNVPSQNSQCLVFHVLFFLCIFVTYLQRSGN